MVGGTRDIFRDDPQDIEQPLTVIPIRVGIALR
jgi:hypothetical protein